MFRRICLRLAVVAMLAATLAISATGAEAADKKVFKVGYVVYVGFMPMKWMEQSGILKKWADKYGIQIQILQVNDYVGSVNSFIAGDLDAVGMAGMDALTMPAAGGVDSTIALVTDYSNGNDALISKSTKSVKDLVGHTVSLVQFSVSHYLLERALVLNGLQGLSQVKTVNVSDADIASAFLTQATIQDAVSWKPMIGDMLHAKGAHILFDSSQIPGEIMDSFVIKTKMMKDHPEFAKALIGAWYETMALYKAGGAKADDMSAKMASAMGTDTPTFLSQTKTTHFFYTPQEEYAFMTAAKTATTWDNIRHFCFSQGLFGQGADSVDSVGIALPNDVILGDKSNVKLRFDPSVIALAQDGKL